MPDTRRVLTSNQTELTDDAVYVSGTFWSTIGLVVLTVTLGWFAWRTLAVAKNRRILLWEQTVVPMLRNDQRLTGDLVVHWRGVQVDSPALANLRILNASKSDIGTNAFDGQRPIEVQFNANVLALLEPAVTAKDGLVPVRLEGNAIHIGPGLLRAGESINVVALLDSISECSLVAPLENVKIEEHDRNEDSASPPSRGQARAILISFLMILFGVIATAIGVFKSH